MNSLILALIPIIGILGYYIHVLSISGAIGATFVGICVYLGFDMKGLLLLGTFFASSSLWSILFKEQKKQAHDKNQKGDKRDIFQVFANGLVPSISSIIYFFVPNEIWLIIFIASIASANSDTWASEIGPLSKKKPIHVLTFKRVVAGTSGAVSLLGLFAAFLGSLIITGMAGLLWMKITIVEIVLLAIAGFLGNLADTMLGAFIQASYTCEKCGVETEKTVHCYKKTKLTKGFRWFDNEVVNLSSIIIGSLIAYFIYMIVS